MSSLLLLTLALWSGFSNPPRENRPWCYWYCVNGNVDHATVTSDLEAMKRVGFGGLLLLDPRGYDKVVRKPEPKMSFGSPEWREMVVFYVVLNIAWLVVWQACARRLIGLRYRHALLDIAPFLLFALGVMTACWWLTSSMPLSWFRMILRILLAVALYVGSLWLARAQILMESIDYIFKRKK